MRAALVSYYYPEYTASLANALADQSVEILLIMPKPEMKRLESWLNPTVTLCPFPAHRLRDPRSAVAVWQMSRVIRSWQPDVVHLQQGQFWFNLVGLRLLKSLCLVTTVHDVVSHQGDLYARRTPQWVWDIGIGQAAHLIVHGETLRAQLVQRHHVPVESVHVIPHGEFTFYTQWAQLDATEELAVLFFGRIWPYKGLQYLIQAEPLISARVPGVKFVIAGEGENFDKYEQMMVHPERFEVHNRYIPVEEVAGLFQRASVVCLPYVEASQSGVIPLAYAFARPVVASRVASIPEVVEHGRTGYLVSPCNVEELAHAVAALLEDSELRRQMGKWASQKAAADLSWEKIAVGAKTVYEAALAAGAMKGGASCLSPM